MTQVRKTGFAVLLLVVFWLVYAQDSSWLTGNWQGTHQGITFLMTIEPDGSYLYKTAKGDYVEYGYWQFDGMSFSQQWQDPRTGQDMAETYRLEFSSNDSFVMSEGNFSEPMTFYRFAPAPIAAPQTGNYTCFTMTVMNTTIYVYNPQLGMVPMITPSYMPSPSVIGTLTLGLDTYTSSGLNQQGSYTFNQETKEVGFTGVLADLNPAYDGQALSFTYVSDEGTQSHTCTHSE